MIKLKRYKANDLYIGYLGIVKKNNSSYVCDSQGMKRKIVFLKKLPNFYDECKDIRMGVSYLSFHNIHVILSNEIGKVLYYRLVPLTTITMKEKFTFKEIENWEDRFNNISQEDVAKEDISKTTNEPFLDILLTYKTKIDEINDEEKREILKKRIVELGRLYADSLIKIKMNMELPTGLTLENPEVSLRELMVKELVKIDMEIEKELSNNSLREGIKVLERSLGSDKK